MKILIVILAICNILCYVEGNRNCIPILNCTYLMEITDIYYDMTAEENKLLNDSICEFDGPNLMVVCPKKKVDQRCFTPDGNMGTCKSILQCPHLLNARNLPNNQNNSNYIHIHRCEGPDDNHVCCGPLASLPYRYDIECKPSVAPLAPASGCCGRVVPSQNRIVGGYETAIDQYPWLALIEYRVLGEKSTELKCGGALISSKYVLTAGHCIQGTITNLYEPINVRLSEYDISSDGPDCSVDYPNDCTNGTVVIPIERVRAYGGYSPIDSNKYDIALIRLKYEVPYHDFIRPICLPTFDIAQVSGNHESVIFSVAGWGAVNETVGYSNITRDVDVPYVSLEDCRLYYRNNPNVTLDKHEICAGGVAGKDSCKGDSGGPLMYKKDGAFFVVGIVSSGPAKCGLENFPGIYTNVYNFLPWIRSQMKP